MQRPEFGACQGRVYLNRADARDRKGLRQERLGGDGGDFRDAQACPRRIFPGPGHSVEWKRVDFLLPVSDSRQHRYHRQSDEEYH